jgi:hypothetical protein
MSASTGRHETRALLRAHLAAASGYRHLTRRCPVCYRLLRLAMEPLTAPQAPHPPQDPCTAAGSPPDPETATSAPGRGFGAVPGPSRPPAEGGEAPADPRGDRHGDLHKERQEGESPPAA